MKIGKIISKEIPLRRPGMTRIRLCREQILILAASAFFAAAYLLSGRGEVLREGSILPRSGYGEKDGIYSLEVDGLPEGRQRIDVRVRAREYTQQEAEDAFHMCMQDIHFCRHCSGCSFRNTGRKFVPAGGQQRSAAAGSVFVLSRYTPELEFGRQHTDLTFGRSA